jgi:hypothetical protein
MAQTLTNMGLKIWDQPGDFFSYADLAGNFTSIDTHDHSGGKGVPIPTGGIANLAITGAKIASATIDSSKITPASLTDATLASPMGSAYKNIAFISGFMSSNMAASTLYLPRGGSGSVFATGSQPSPYATGIQIPINAADIAVSNKTTRLRLMISYGTNTIAPATSFTWSLVPLTFAGASSAMIYNAGLAVTGSPVTLTTPAASTASFVTGTDFAPPANGVYTFSVTINPAAAAGSWLDWTAYLQYHHV